MCNDRQLLQKIAGERDAQAFDALCERHREPLHRFLVGQTGSDSAGADDLLQETLLRLWLKADSYDGRGPVKAWLFRIAAHLAANYRRSLSRRRETRLTHSADADDESGAAANWERDNGDNRPEAQAVSHNRAAQFRGLINEMPEETRELLRLVHDENTTRDIAAALHLPEGTIKSRLHNARKRAARTWNERHPDDPI